MVCGGGGWEAGKEGGWWSYFSKKNSTKDYAHPSCPHSFFSFLEGIDGGKFGPIYIYIFCGFKFLKYVRVFFVFVILKILWNIWTRNIFNQSWPNGMKHLIIFSISKGGIKGLFGGHKVFFVPQPWHLIIGLFLKGRSFLIIHSWGFPPCHT